MKIISENGKNTYFDTNGVEIHEGDTVLLDGKEKKVYLTKEGELGTDATNPAWITRGWAIECEYGVYPFGQYDEPVLVQ